MKNQIVTGLNSILKGSDARMRVGTARKFLLGSRDKNGILFQSFVYLMLVSLGFVYLYPLLTMLVDSVKTLPDLLDVSVRWIPTSITLEHYVDAFKAMKVSESFWVSITVGVFPAIGQMVICALTGYGLARYKFPFKKLVLMLVLITFIVPPYILMIPNFALFSDYKIVGTIWTLILPATAGQGLKSAIFILIFMQFFNKTPLSLDEAARVDGCSELFIFLRIAIPLAIPAFVMSFLFSFVWYWNETYFTTLYLGGANLGDVTTTRTMLIELSRFEQSYAGYLQSLSGAAYLQAVSSDTENIANEAIKMSATMVTILPLLIVYLVLQRQFVEAIDRTGITGE